MKKQEFFLAANSCAAPFFSDFSTSFVTASTADEAMRLFRKRYKHPSGLFAAQVFASAKDYHKRKKPLVSWSKE